MIEQNVLLLIITGLSVVLVALILLQNRGGGLGTVFGGGGGETFRTRRGAEKLIFYSTIFTVVLWIGLLLANLYFYS